MCDEQVDCRVTSSHPIHFRQRGHVTAERHDEHGQQNDRLDERQFVEPRHLFVNVRVIHRPTAVTHNQRRRRRVQPLPRRSRRTDVIFGHRLTTSPRRRDVQEVAGLHIGTPRCSNSHPMKSNCLHTRTFYCSAVF